MREGTEARVSGRLSRFAVGGAIVALLAAGCTGAPSTETVDSTPGSSSDGGSSSDTGGPSNGGGAGGGPVPEGRETF